MYIGKGLYLSNIELDPIWYEGVIRHKIQVLQHIRQSPSAYTLDSCCLGAAMRFLFIFSHVFRDNLNIFEISFCINNLRAIGE